MSERKVRVAARMALAGCALVALGATVAVGATAAATARTAPSMPSTQSSRVAGERAGRAIVVDGEVVDLMDTSDTGAY